MLRVIENTKMTLLVDQISILQGWFRMYDLFSAQCDAVLRSSTITLILRVHFMKQI
jgi:hypothetical protein